MRKIIDLTHPVAPDMPVFPGDPPVNFRVAAEISRDGFHETELTISSHTGTHVDAPSHVIPGGLTLDRLPMTSFFGTAVVVDCTDIPAGGRVTLDKIRGTKGADEAEFLILRTGWENFWGNEKFFGDYPVLEDEAARWIVDAHKKGVGLDVMSLDPISSESLPLHHILLSAGVLIVENLRCLEDLPSGLFNFCALPIKLADADGSPARAVAFWDEE